MKNALPITAFVLLLAGGIYFLRSCHSGPSPETVAATRKADSALHILDSTKAADLPVIASLKADTARMTRKMDTLSRQKTSLEKQIKTAGQTIRATLARIDSAKSQHDTAGIAKNGLVLADQVEHISPVIQADETIGAGMINQCIEQGKVKDSIAHYWEDLFHIADTSARLQKTANISLQKDFDRTQFALKIWKPVAIGGAAYITLNIIIHSLKK